MTYDELPTDRPGVFFYWQHHGLRVEIDDSARDCFDTVAYMLDMGDCAFGEFWVDGEKQRSGAMLSDYHDARDAAEKEWAAKRPKPARTVTFEMRPGEGDRKAQLNVTDEWIDRYREWISAAMPAGQWTEKEL